MLKDPAIVIAVNVVTARQPPSEYEAYRMICDSHSFAIHDCPAKVWENSSWRGKAPVRQMCSPTPMCQKVSGSWSSRSERRTRYVRVPRKNTGPNHQRAPWVSAATDGGPFI